MEYSFISDCYREGNRIFIKIPFNIWDMCGKKGNIPVQVVIDNISFECKLIPKGNGEYVIPVKRDYFIKLDTKSDYRIHFNLLDQLTRINNNSPYSKDNPIRHIDSICYVHQPDNGCCGQTCLAMLSGLTVEEVMKIMISTKWQVSMSKVLETLDYFGFLYKKPVYTHGQKVDLPKCCIINVRELPKTHLLVYFDGVFYDPASGVKQDYQFDNIISYIEIT